MDLREVLALNVRRIRHQKGLTQEELADAAGINRTYMSKVETSRTYAGLEIIARLAKSLDVEAHELLSRPSRKSRHSAG
jgi:transcriptional regulator with XRE-family HTH domain